MAQNNHNQVILFLLVNNFTSGGAGSRTSRSGLLNSATLTANQITTYLHYKTVVDTVKDYTAIPEAIQVYNPSIVVLEAIWVTPPQVQELTTQFPNIIFVTRVHSEVPFLSHENNAINYIKSLVGIKNSYVAFNSQEAYNDFFALGYKPEYLPNIFQDVYAIACEKESFTGSVLNVGCFGSIRPMKNQLMQALCAMVYCDLHKIKLVFHINSTRVEQQGGCTLNNIRGLFAGTSHELVEHDWLDRTDFLKLVSTMDMGMQISFNESFNIVTADFVLQGIPIVVSEAISWMPTESQAMYDNIADILKKITWCLGRTKKSISDNIAALDNFNTASVDAWKKFLTVII